LIGNIRPGKLIKIACKKINAKYFAYQCRLCKYNRSKLPERRHEKLLKSGLRRPLAERWLASSLRRG
jgi:hypothetical protein